MVSQFGKSGNIGRDIGSGRVMTTLGWASGLLIALFQPLYGQEQSRPDFNRQIRPLISDRCLSCHGPDAHHREAELRLDQQESATLDRGGYFVVKPGDVDRSELIARITSDDADVVMPPPEYGKPLTQAEIQLLQSWISSGAEYQPHWAYVSPKATSSSQTAASLRIDMQIQKRLRDEGLRPSPQAAPNVLVRRLSFDLTGLPPDPKDVAAFVTNPSDEAWEALIDRYLATDAYAERMAMYWLDLVRFADTVGYHGDQDHSISPYRDWVIDAFADNMAFDQFTAEQLAGDLLPNADIDQKIASGYNRLLQTSHEGGVQKKEYLAIYQADRVRNVSAVWMGATVGCAQCHDHKYDPYTAKDFYAMAAFFADIDEEQHFSRGTNSLPTSRPPELTVHSRRERQRLTRMQQQLTELENRLQQSPDDKQLIGQQKRLSNEHEDLKRAARRTMISSSLEKPRPVRLLPRGDWLDESGPIVAPAVPEFLGVIPGTTGRATRLDLARWLTDSQNGSGQLTARVFANRFWFLLMGRGIAADLEDFGGQGTPPEHPQLLDDLALEFVNSQWNVRHVLKTILMSRTYRQSSAWSDELLQKDPENLLLARQTAFRLPAEMVRDSALKISGLLVEDVGGASVKPYQPAGYYRHLNFPTRKYTHHDDARQWRRGLYVHWQRQFLHPMMKAFDGPSREECTAERPRSNTPLAALTLLNDPTFVEASRAFAERILTEASAPDTASRLNFASQLVLSRALDKAETKLLTQLHDDARNDYLSNESSAADAVSVGLSKRRPDLNTADLAAWTTVARTILNLDEAITRN